MQSKKFECSETKNTVFENQLIRRNLLAVMSVEGESVETINEYIKWRYVTLSKISSLINLMMLANDSWSSDITTTYSALWTVSDYVDELKMLFEKL